MLYVFICLFLFETASNSALQLSRQFILCVSPLTTITKDHVLRLGFLLSSSAKSFVLCSLASALWDRFKRVSSSYVEKRKTVISFRYQQVHCLSQRKHFFYPAVRSCDQRLSCYAITEFIKRKVRILMTTKKSKIISLYLAIGNHFRKVHQTSIC